MCTALRCFHVHCTAFMFTALLACAALLCTACVCTALLMCALHYLCAMHCLCVHCTTCVHCTAYVCAALKENKGHFQAQSVNSSFVQQLSLDSFPLSQLLIAGILLVVVRSVWVGGWISVCMCVRVQGTLTDFISL
jgi:hypothetical protein